MRAPAAALAISLLAGCASAVRVPTEDDARRAAALWPATRRADLERGRDLYIHRCASCHQLHLPTEEPASRWPAILGEMAPRASLTGPERELVERYLVTIAAR